MVPDESKPRTKGIDCHPAVIKPMMVAVMDVDEQTGLVFVCHRQAGFPEEKRFQNYYYECGHAFARSIINERWQTPSVQALKQAAESTTFKKVRAQPSTIGCLAVDSKASHC